MEGIELDFGKVPGIYCFENKVDGKKYIGKSVCLYDRICSHLRSLARGKDSSSILQNAWNKHGKENFVWYVVELCPKSKLNQRERYYIKNWKTQRPNGYNIATGGDGVSGVTLSTEHRMKIGDAVRGEKNAWFGKSLPEYVKEKMRKNHADFSGKNHPQWGKPKTDETKRKISETKRKNGGQNLVKNPRFGKKLSRSSSKYYGVSWNKGSNRWLIYTTRFGKKINIGSHKIEETAARIYDAYVIENGFVECPLNFLESKDKSVESKDLALDKAKEEYMKKKSSKYFGVSKFKDNPMWLAFVMENKKMVYQKYFKTEIDAAKARDEYIIEHNLEKPLNFPK